MLAVPWLAAVLTVKTLPSVRPSASVAVRVPVRTVSSAPLPLVPPVTVVGSLTGVTLIVSMAWTLVSAPPLATPPLSCSLKPIVA